MSKKEKISACSTIRKRWRSCDSGACCTPGSARRYRTCMRLLGTGHFNVLWSIGARRLMPAMLRQRPTLAQSITKRTDALQIAAGLTHNDKSPASIYSDLLNHGSYVLSPRTFNRILQSEHLQQERRRITRQPSYQKPQIMAEGPCEVRTWDIAKLKSTQRRALQPVCRVGKLQSNICRMALGRSTRWLFDEDAA